MILVSTTFIIIMTFLKLTDLRHFTKSFAVALNQIDCHDQRNMHVVNET